MRLNVEKVLCGGGEILPKFRLVKIMYKKINKNLNRIINRIHSKSV